MKRILLTIIVFQIISAVSVLADEQRDSLYYEKKYQGMTKDQIAAYEDSVLKANYPAVHIETIPDVGRKTETTEPRRSLSSGYVAIENSIVPNTASVNTSLGVGEIEIRPEALPSGAKGYTVPIKA